LSAIKGLTLTNALVVLMLAFAIGPFYLLATEPELLDRFLSSYSVIDVNSPCVLRKGRERGEPYTWGISAGFAYEGGTQWSVSVILRREPDAAEIEKYCTALLLIVDKLRRDEGRR
jgi:hypothetical protein